MKRMKIMGTLLAAVFVIGLVGATSAMAASTNNPQWLILSKVLLAGQTELIDAEANGTQKLSSTGLTIECKKFSLLNHPILIGSNAPAPGTSEETIMYSGCEVIGTGFAACKINGVAGGAGEIETKPLRDLLVFLTELGALKEEASASGTLFEPKTPTTFSEFGLTEANPGTKECPLTGIAKVDGTGVLVNNLTTNHLVTQEIEAPTVAKKVYWVNEGGKTVQRTGVKIEVAAAVATYSGKAKILLASKEPWGIFN